MKKLRNKMTLYFALILTISAIIIASSVYVVLTITDISLFSSILIFVVVILTFILVKLNNELAYLKHEFVLRNLLLNKEKPIHSKMVITSDQYVTMLTETLDYKQYTTNSDFTLYYKVVKGATKRRKHSTLYAILVYKKDKSFIEDASNQMFESLEKYLNKKEKYNQRIFVQLKQIATNYTDEDIEDTDKIFFISHRRNNIVLINLLFNRKTNQVYYLKSDNIKLPLYFKIAYDEINKLH